MTCASRAQVTVPTWPLVTSRPTRVQVLPSIVNETVKQVIAQFNATALLTQREQVWNSLSLVA